MGYTLGRSATHCSFCGASFDGVEGWPRDCVSCDETTWLNPLPVAVALLPVVSGSGEDGLVVVRRTIEPAYGASSLPGGYMEVGETWREATVRELFEETRIEVSPKEVELFNVDNGGATVQVFGLLPKCSVGELPESRPTDETDGWFVITGPEVLAFPTQTSAVASYFASVR